jgi:hypothetical protein
VKERKLLFKVSGYMEKTESASDAALVSVHSSQEALDDTLEDQPGEYLQNLCAIRSGILHKLSTVAEVCLNQLEAARRLSCCCFVLTLCHVSCIFWYPTWSGNQKITEAFSSTHL